jgi:hypothetical protein
VAGEREYEEQGASREERRVREKEGARRESRESQRESQGRKRARREEVEVGDTMQAGQSAEPAPHRLRLINRIRGIPRSLLNMDVDLAINIIYVYICEYLCSISYSSIFISMVQIQMLRLFSEWRRR